MEIAYYQSTRNGYQNLESAEASFLFLLPERKDRDRVLGR
jgi:hypothetical protein